MTVYDSDIVLGRTYRHNKLGLEGIAESVHFYANACERVVLIYLNDGEVKEASFDAVDLTNVATEKRVENKQYKPGGPKRTMPAHR
jgi:hypothetical protein